MIHIRHSAAAQIRRQRRMAAICSAFYALFLLLSIFFTAHFIICLKPYYETGCELQGIHFSPSDIQEAPPEPKHQTPEKFSPKTSPVLYLDTPELPTAEVDFSLTELALLECTPEDDFLLETDAEALLLPSERQKSPAARQEETQKSGEDYIPPAYKNCPKPPYPPVMRQRREERTVGILIEINAEGTPTAVNITRTSGNHTLDQHTRRWILKNWSFVPARLNGRNTAARISTELHYTLSR